MIFLFFCCYQTYEPMNLEPLNRGIKTLMKTNNRLDDNSESTIT
jgi:hypothetical protein